MLLLHLRCGAVVQPPFRRSSPRGVGNCRHFLGEERLLALGFGAVQLGCEFAPLDAETVMEGRRWGFGAWGLG